MQIPPPARGTPRRPRPSLPYGSDEIAHLSLSEVRDRLARNERVLNMSLFSTSPTAISPLAAGPSYRRASEPPAGEDPVRDRLLAVRSALQARESELVIAIAEDGMGKMEMGDSEDRYRAMTSSPPARSGKQRALDAIRQGEEGMALNGLILPISQSLALGERDYDNQTAAQLASLSLSGDSSSRSSLRGKRRQGPRGLTSESTIDMDDEMGRAQQAARMSSFSGQGSSDDGNEDGDEDDIFDADDRYLGEEEREYDGDGMPLDTPANNEAAGYDMDQDVTVDDERFSEGNDEYGDGAGPDSLNAGPDPTE